MSQSSILQRIHQETNVFGLDDVARTQVRGVELQAHSAGYELTTSVTSGADGVRHRMYGALIIDVKAERGIFGNDAPLSVEVSPGERRGTIALQHNSVTEVAGLNDVQLSTYCPPKRERLLLPGDKGFKTFGELHGRMTQIGNGVSLIADMLEIDDVNSFGMSLVYGSALVEPDKSTRYHRMDYYSLGTSQTQSDRPHMLELHMRTVGAQDSKPPESLLYTSGDLHRVDQPGPKAYWREGIIVHFTGEPSKRLDFEELIAFSAIGTCIQDLAPKNAY